MFLYENNCSSSCSYFCSRSAIFFFNFKTKSSSSSFFMWTADNFSCSSDINKSFADFSTKSELYSRYGVSISAVSGADVAPAIFVCDELLHTTLLLSFTECITSLNSDSKLFATGVTVERGVGGGRLRGELRFHAKILGTAPGLGLSLWLRLLFKSSGLKCLEQTLVPTFIEKFGHTSLLIACMEPLFSEVCIIWKTKEGNIFARILVSLILLRTQRNAAICWHLSVDFQGEKRSCRPKLSFTETNMIFSATILRKIKISVYLCATLVASKLQYNTNLSALQVLSGLPSLVLMYSKPGRSARPPFMNTVY